MMSGKQSNADWWVTGACVRGASHVRNNLPNQDAIGWRSVGNAVLLAVADGHGSPRYIRSHQGAKLAVHVALAELEHFLADSQDPAGIKRRAEEQLPRTLVRGWQAQVEQKLARAPLTPQEENKLAQLANTAPPPTSPQPVSRAPQLTRTAADSPAPNAAGENSHRPHRIFGATLLATVLTREFGLFLQLGDGDIITVDAKGQAAHVPLATDARLIANQTTSLAGRTAWQDMRVYFQPFVEAPPALVLLATDGYANSFADDNGVLNAAQDFHALLCEHGPAYVRRRLAGWLTATTEHGSGDDISVGLVAFLG